MISSNDTGSAASVAKNTKVIPSNQKNGTYTVTHDGYTYRYIVSNAAGGDVDQFQRISFWVDPLEDVNADGRLLLSNPSQINTWTPPVSFFPPNVIVRKFEYQEQLRLDDGTLIRSSVEQTGFFQTPKPKKKKPEEVPDLSSPPVMTLNDFGLGRFNPPPHNTSRTLPPTAFPNYGTTDSANNSIFTQLKSANNRGYFYQDLDSSIDLQGKQKKKSELWGFQFMYNPTTISYTNQANSAIDYGNTDDVANQLVGSQSISFEILINRTADVSALRDTYNNYSSRAIMSTTGINDGYPRVLTPDEVVGLYRRGTEYDIEFLYRCLNGDPQATQAMLEPTSDYGYLAGIPVWLRFNDNVRYKGIINGISVEHVMFSENMVPMISKVSLTFLRLPTPLVSGTDADLKDFYTKQFSKVPNFSGAARTTAESE